MTSKVSIISRALNLLGEPPINDISGFPGNNPVYNAASVWYDTLVRTLLGDGEPWRFALVTRQLNVLTATPDDSRWTYILQIPTDPNFLLNYKVHYSSGLDLPEYDIKEDKVYANTNEVWMTYTFAPDADKFPPYFELLMIYELAAHLAMTVTNSEKLLEIWATKATKQRLQARAIDSKRVPSENFPAGPLFDAHVAGGSSYVGDY